MPSLTDRAVTRLQPPAKGRRLVFDDHRDAPKGFGVRVTAAGKRVFVLRYFSHDGKDRLLSIGEYPTWSLAAARKRAGELRREIDGGADILERRREDRSEPTVADVTERFLKSKAALASHADMASALRRYLISALGNKKMREVRRRDVIPIIENLSATYPRQAGLVLTYTKQVFSYAEDREIIEASPVATLRPEKIGKRLMAGKRDRVLSDAEIQALWTRIEPPAGMHAATLLALKLILITGQRPGEVCGMRWSEVQGDLWTIPSSRRGKTDSAHTVALTATALALLEQAPRRGEYVFSTRGTPIATNAIAKAVLRCSDALGMADPRWRPHDLRRTCRTGLAAAGVSETVAEAVVGHTRKGIAAVYDLHRYDAEKRAALEAWERRLLRIVEGKPAEDNVVPMTREQTL